MCILVALNLLPNSRSPPVAQWFTFPSFGSEGHGVQPPVEGLQIFFAVCFFCFMLFLFCFEKIKEWT